MNKYLTNDKSLTIFKTSWRIPSGETVSQAYGPNTLELNKKLNKKIKYKIKKVKQTGNKAVVTLQVSMVNTDNFVINRYKLAQNVEESDYAMAASLLTMSDSQLQSELNKMGFDASKEQVLNFLWLLMGGTSTQANATITDSDGTTIKYIQLQYIYAKMLEKMDNLAKTSSQYINYGSRTKRTMKLTLVKKSGKWKIDKFGSVKGKLRYLIGGDLNRNVTQYSQSGAYTIEKWQDYSASLNLNDYIK
ncbi:MAG: hypothetical protein E7294_05065 [Lachnospiraceae bacterium]|nr:hypothetical protein [Lachnospiraceae bacterium]